MNAYAKLRAAWDALYEAALLGKHSDAQNWLQQKGREGEAAISDLERAAGDPVGFQPRRNGASDWGGVITHRPPDSYELRECEIRNVYATPPIPAGTFTAAEIECAYRESAAIWCNDTVETDGDWLHSDAYKLVQERTK